MFVQHLWGDLWVVDSDPLTAIIGNVLIFCFLVALTLAVLALWLPFMGIKWAWGQMNSPAPITVSVGTGAALAERHAPHARADSCPQCGNTASRDIRPCIRCGN
jgi:hypothetical protein